MIASSVQVGSGGDTVTISAVVKDSNNVALAGAPVSLLRQQRQADRVSADHQRAPASRRVVRGRRRPEQSPVDDHGQVGLGERARSSLDIVGTVLSYTGVTTVPLNGLANLADQGGGLARHAIRGFPVTVTSSLGNGLSAERRW